MAFAAEQKRDIRKYMGVSFGFYDLNRRLESMMDLVGSNATDQLQITTWLDRLEDIDDDLTGDDASGGTTGTFGAVKKVDEVEFFAPTEASASGSTSLTLVAQGRTIIARIARALGVSDYLPIGDYFGSRRPMGFTIPLG